MENWSLPVSQFEGDRLGVRLSDGPNSKTVWHHIHGVIKRPNGWVFVPLPTKSAGMTRSLKSRAHWQVEERPRNKDGTHRKRRVVGLLVPPDSLKAAGGAPKHVTKNAGAKARKEQRDIKELETAIVAFLRFAKPHAALAKQIAQDAAASAKVGSGGVGRTTKKTLKERAVLAARAHIRHQHTPYELAIETSKRKGAKRMSKTSKKYLAIKAQAHRDVDAFLEAHR